jgi:hypothetical protein
MGEKISSAEKLTPENQLLPDGSASKEVLLKSRQKVKGEEKKSAKNPSAAPLGKKFANTAITFSALSVRAREKAFEFGDRLAVEQAKDVGHRKKFLAMPNEMVARKKTKG